MPVVWGPDGTEREMAPEMAQSVTRDVMMEGIRAMSGMPPNPEYEGGSAQLMGQAAVSVMKYLMGGVIDPIKGVMDAARRGEYNLGAGEGYDASDPLFAAAVGIGAGWRGGLPRGATGIGMTKWPSVKKAIEGIPRYRHGDLETLTNLRKQFPGLGKEEFDEMVLGLAREGKIALHRHDLPKGYKGEMIVEEVPGLGDRGEIVKEKVYYHAFGVKPEWR